MGAGRCWGIRWVGFVLLMAVSGAMAVAPAVAVAETPLYLGSFGPDGTEETSFEDVNSVAIDQQSGNLYVLDRKAGALYKFDASGQSLDFGGSSPYITGNRLGGLSAEVFPTLNEAQVAVNPASGTIYATEPTALKAFEPDGEEAQFSAGPGAGSNEIGGFSALAGVAVDPSGNVYASDRANGTVAVYTSAGEQLTQIARESPRTLAIDEASNVYVHPSEVAPLVKLTPNEVPVAATTTYSASEPIPFNASVEFRWGFGVDPLVGDVYSSLFNGDKGSWVAQTSPSGALISEYTAGEEEVSQGVAVVEGGETFYVGTNADRVAIFGQQPPGPPTIGSAGAYQVSADSATLEARINPRKLSTTFRFEFGTSDCSLSSSGCTAVPQPDRAIGAGNQPVKVSQPITGLMPGTTYYLRAVAENAEGSDEANRVFTTQSLSAGFRLSDSRVWEMVSPPDKQDGGIVINNKAVFKASAPGDRLVYKSRGSLEADPQGNRSPELSSYLADRSSAADWSSEDITSPHEQANILQGQDEFFRFSTDLSKALLEPRDETPLSSEATEYTPYIRTDTDPPTYTPLLTEANVAPGIHWGGKKAAIRIRPTGASPDLRHVTLSSQTPLLEGAVAGTLYHWSAGSLEIVSELPADEGGGIVEGELGSQNGSIRHAISDDGSRLFWTPEPGKYASLSLPGLYVRYTESHKTTRLDVVQTGASGAGEIGPAFQEATPDGRVVFFTDSRQLTVGASTSGRDLYRCELGADPSEGCITLTDVSAPLEGSGEIANVKELTPAVGEQGNRAYFVAEGVLDTAANGIGDTAVSGKPNLYLWEEGHAPRFIATLAPAAFKGEGDSSVWGLGELAPSGRAALMSSYGSPDGRYFTFMSERSLTGYINDSPRDDTPMEEVFVYDAVSDRLDCISCIPTGAGATGQLSPGSGQSDSAIDPQGLWNGRQVSAVLPQASGDIAAPVLRQPRVVFDSGRVLFNAFDALVPADTNNDWDVYEYEPLGTGDCTASPISTAVARSGGGCVALISSGTDEGQSAFLEASASGDDVFFLTRGRLSVLDEDNAVDVYDARVNGKAAVLQPASECTGEGCRPPTQAPENSRPASETFRGPGNVTSCPKGKRKVHRNGRTKCVQRKHHKKHSSKHRRAHGKTKRGHR